VPQDRDERDRYQDQRYQLRGIFVVLQQKKFRRRARQSDEQDAEQDSADSGDRRLRQMTSLRVSS